MEDGWYDALIASGVEHTVAMSYQLTAPLLVENRAISRYVMDEGDLNVRRELPELLSISDAVCLARREYMLTEGQQMTLARMLDELRESEGAPRGFASAGMNEDIIDHTSGLAPKMIQIGMAASFAHIVAGARDFADYSVRMIDDLGEVVHPYLKSWYMAARHYPEFDNTGMDTELDILADEDSANSTVKRIATELPSAVMQENKLRDVLHTQRPTANQARILASVLERMAELDNDPSALIAAQKLRKSLE
jgi:hypothetical protein